MILVLILVALAFYVSQTIVYGLFAGTSVVMWDKEWKLNIALAVILAAVFFVFVLVLRMLGVVKKKITF